MTADQIISQELERTAKRTTRRLINEANRLGIGTTGALVDSIRTMVTGHVMDVYFNTSGRFIDMGVSRGISLAEVKQLGMASGRKVKRFYSRTVYSEASLFAYAASGRFVDETIEQMQQLDGLNIQL